MRFSRLLYLLLLFLTVACEKEIKVDLPPAEAKLVVEGRIEQDQMAYVILTNSTGFFEPTDLTSLEGLFVHDARVTVTVDGIPFVLPETCLNELEPGLRSVIAEMLGLNLDNNPINYCVYINPILIGQPDKTYLLEIETGDETYEAETKIPNPVALDSLWYEPAVGNSLGFVWAQISDPDTIGNAYRWFARRINPGADGNDKDSRYIPPFGSAFQDKFINGQTFSFGFQRGEADNEAELPPEERGYFKTGDTIVIKFTSIDQPHYQFLRIFETEVFNNGNPFAAPTSIPSNIEGGALGIWGGYGAAYDTIVALPR